MRHPSDQLYGKAALRIEQMKRGCDGVVVLDQTEVSGKSDEQTGNNAEQTVGKCNEQTGGEIAKQIGGKSDKQLREMLLPCIKAAARG